jgi:hypothetical protein
MTSESSVDGVACAIVPLVPVVILTSMAPDIKTIAMMRVELIEKIIFLKR